MGRILLRLLMSLFPSPLEQEVGKTMRDILGHCRHRDRRAYDTAVLTLRDPIGEYLERPGLRRRERAIAGGILSAIRDDAGQDKE